MLGKMKKNMGEVVKSLVKNRVKEKDFVSGKVVATCKLCGKPALGSEFIDAVDGKSENVRTLRALQGIKRVHGLLNGPFAPILSKVNSVQKDCDDVGSTYEDTLIGIAIYSHLTRNHKKEFVEFVNLLRKGDIKKAYLSFFEIEPTLLKRLFGPVSEK